MKKILVVFLCLMMLVQNFPLAAFAAAEDNMCEHHTTHTAECGYIQAVEGADCAHVHDSTCGYTEGVAEVKCACEATDENGALIHAEGCGYVAAKAGSDCTHAHDAACGYVQAVEGHECNFECAECSAAEITEPVQDSQKMLLSDNPYDDFYDEIDKPNPDVDSDPFKSVTVYFALNLVDGNNVPIASNYTVNGKSDTANTTASVVTVTFEADIADNVTDEYSYWKDDAITLIIPKIQGYVTPGTVTFDWYFNHITESEYLKTESGEKVASEKNIDGLDIGYYTYTIQLAPCTHETHENGACTVCGANNAAVQLTRGETVTYYTDLSSAAADINLTPSGTTAKVKLLKNSTVAGRVDLMPSALELDLNGCTVTYTGSVSNDTMLSLNNTSAVICDSSAEKNGMINGNGLARVTIYGSSVEMRSGTITGKEPIWLYSAATFTLTGGKVRADGTGRGEACIHPYASSTAAYINGGTLEGAYGVHAEKGTVFVSGNPTFSVTKAEAFLKENGIIDLTDMTDPDGFVTELENDLTKPYDSILIPAGYRIYNGETMMENTAPQAYAFLTVKAHTDHTSTGDNVATCTEKAVCDVCDLPYGPEPAGHSTNQDGDRFATCIEKAYCSVCESEYGELNSNNHDYEWVYDGTYHWQVCTRDESHVTEKCGSEFYHSYMMGDGDIIEVTQKCDDCGYSGEYAEVYLSGSSFTYTGEAINPHITKYPDSWLGEQNIIPGYSNNVNVTNSATLTLDRYSLTFAITPREITAPAFEGLKESYPHTGKTVEPAFTLNDDLGNVIPADEYTVSYSDNTDAGTATITITDVSGGNYIVSGSAAFQIVEHIHEFTFTADGATITAVCANTDGGCPDTEQSVTLIAENTGYTGEIVNSVYFLNGIDGQTVTLHYTGTDYDSEDSPVNAGTYTVTMTVGGNRVSKTFTVAPMNIAYCNPVLQQNSFTYSGTAPALSVAAVNGSVGWTGLVQGTDFTLGAVAVNAGNHKLTVSGFGNYGGTVELDYTINPAPITITGADIKSVPYNPDGYELEVTGVTISGVVGNDFLVIGTDFTASAVLTGTNAVGSPSAVVTVTMINKNYSLTKAEVETVVSITKADPTYTVPTGLTATYGETLTDVTLNAAAGDTPGTWTWVDSGDTPVGSVGSQTHKAVFTPTDINNYKTVSDVDITIQVSKANAILSWANAVESVEYTGSPAMITAPTVTLADDDTFVGAINYTYIGTSGGKEVSGSGLPTNAGTYEITASVAEVDNYAAATSSKTLKLTINKIDPAYTNPSGLAATYGDTLAKVTLPKGFAWEDATTTSVGNAGTNTFKITYTPDDTVNYNVVTGIEISVAVAEAAATVATAPTANDLTYTSKDQALVTAGTTADGTMVYSLTKDGDYSATIPTGTGAGKYTVWYYVKGDDNHADSAKTSVTVEIEKAKLTIAAEDNTITYGDAPAANGVICNGFIIGEDMTVLAGTLAYSYDYEQYGKVGTYAITPAGLTSDNYEITFLDGTLTVNAKAITVTAEAKSKTYGDADPELTYTAIDLIGDDKLSGALTRDPGEDVNTYAITQGTLTAGDNYTITYVGADLTVNKRIVTITAKDQTIACGTTISNTEITSTGLVDGHSITVNLTPSTTNVTANGIITVSAAVITADDADVTANYEISYAGSKLVIEPDTSKIDALTTENVTSANEADILAVQEMLENADSTKEEWTAIDEKCEALLDRINEVKEQQKDLTDEAAAYDPDTVKSTDQTDLTELAEEIEALLDTENLTENERAALESLLEQVKGMLETIEGVAEDSKAATDTIESLDPATVTSDDKEDLEQAIETIDELLQGDHLTEDERKVLEDAKADAEALIEKIEAVQDATGTENTEKVEDVTADNVKPEDKEALEDAKADLEKALENNADNYTEEEKTAIQDEIQRIDDAIEALENINDVTEAITQLPETVEPDDEEAAEKISDVKEAYDELTDHEKSLVDEAAKEKLDDLVAAMTAYDIIKGDGGKWTKDSSSGLSFTANGPLSKFVGVEVDGKKVDAKYYDAKAGSTVITLKHSFLSRLSTGEHMITVIYTDGETSGIFKVMEASSVPSTGDDSDIILPAAMFVVSFAVMTVILAVSEKRKREN